MSDLVVTVPMKLWASWIREGDAAGEPATGEEWGFYLGSRRPPIEPGDRLYIVAHGRVRGYSPVTRLARVDGSWAIGREGGGVAVTIGAPVKGFRGWRKRWWELEAEVAFPGWEFAGVPGDLALDAIRRHSGLRAPQLYQDALVEAGAFIGERLGAGAVSVKVSELVPTLERLGLATPDAETLARWVAIERGRTVGYAAPPEDRWLTAEQLVEHTGRTAETYTKTAVEVVPLDPAHVALTSAGKIYSPAAVKLILARYPERHTRAPVVELVDMAHVAEVVDV